MKPTGILFALLLAAGPVMLPGADDVPGVRSAEPARLSPEVAQKLTTTLPKYAPPAPVVAKPIEPDPDVLELPKMTVKQKPRPRLGMEVVMTGKAFNEKLAHDNLSAFDRNLLNKFTLPAWFGGQSAADRARDEYERQQKAELISDVKTLAKAMEDVDPAKAKALRNDATKP